MSELENVIRKFPYHFGIATTMIAALDKKRDVLYLYEIARETIKHGRVRNVSRVPGLLEFWDYVEVMYEEGVLEGHPNDSLRDEFLSDAIKKGYNIPDGEKGKEHKEKIRYVVREIRRWSDSSERVLTN